MKTAYRQIFNASALFGGVQVILFLVMLVRSKVIAQYLGPDGYGIHTLFNSTILFVTGIASLGLNNSAVREISEASASGDENRLNRTVAIFMKWTTLSGIIGMFFMLLFSGSLSKWTFKSDSYTVSFALLSVIPLFTVLANARISVMQGTGHLKKIARVSTFSAIFGLLTLPLYLFFGIKAIVPVLVLLALLPLIFTLYFSRSLHFKRSSLSWFEVIRGGAGMVRLGILITFSSYFYLMASYALNVFITRLNGPGDVGLYQSGWLIANQSITMILTAMSTYYYPRLASINSDNSKIKDLVNQQTEISLLLTGPVLLVLIIFVRFLIHLFLAPEFLSITFFVRWCAIGTFFRVLTWCLGFVLLAKNEAKQYLFCEITGYIVMFTGYFAGYYFLGVNGIGIAYFAGYVFHFFLYYLVLRRSIRFRFTKDSLVLSLIFIISGILMLTCSYLMEGLVLYLVTIPCIALITIYSLKQLDNRIDIRETFFSLYQKTGKRSN